MPTPFPPYPSDRLIMKDKINISRPLSVIPHKVLISLRPLLLRVARQHTLKTDTHAFDVVDGGPAGAVEQVEADDAVGVDVWVPGYGVGFVAEEDYFGGLWGGGLARSGLGEVADIGTRTSIGYCGVKLNFNRYVSPAYNGFESIT